MDDTELYTSLEIESEGEKELSVDSTDQQRYLDLELENEIEVIDSGKADVGDGTLTITQGGVAKGTFNANSKTDVTVDVDAPEEVGNGTLTITQGGVTKGTFSANSKTNATINLDAGGGGSIGYSFKTGSSDRFDLTYKAPYKKIDISFKNKGVVPTFLFNVVNNFYPQEGNEKVPWITSWVQSVTESYASVVVVVYPNQYWSNLGDGQGIDGYTSLTIDYTVIWEEDD